MPEANKPVQKIDAWPLSVAIWKRETNEGRTFYNVTLQRAYIDAQSEYQYTDSLNKEDLLLAAKLLNQAETAVRCLELKDYEARKAA